MLGHTVAANRALVRRRDKPLARRRLQRPYPRCACELEPEAACNHSLWALPRIRATGRRDEHGRSSCPFTPFRRPSRDNICALESRSAGWSGRMIGHDEGRRRSLANGRSAIASSPQPGTAHGVAMRRLNRFMAASTPWVTMHSTASAAFSYASAINTCSRREKGERT